MSIDAETIARIAELSRLKISPEEAEQLTGELESILDFAKQLEEVDTSEVEPTLFAAQNENVFRPDVVGVSLNIDEALKNATDTHERFFRVPRVIDSE